MTNAPEPSWTLNEFGGFLFVSRAKWQPKTSIDGYVVDNTGVRDLDYRDMLTLDNDPSPTIKVSLTTGFGGDYNPYRMTVEDFSSWNETVGIPRTLLETRAQRDHIAHLEYDLKWNGDEISALSLVCDWTPDDINYIWFIAKMDYRNNTFNIIISVDPEGFLGHARIVEMLSTHQKELLEEPLHLIGLLYESAWYICRSWAANCIQWLDALEARIGVSKNMEYYRTKGFEVESEDYDDLNASLFDVNRLTARSKTYATHLKDFTDTLLEILEAVRKQKNSNAGLFDDVKDGWLARKGRGTYQLEFMTKRVDAALNHLEYSHTLCQTLFEVLYNRMLQRDARLNYNISRAAKQDSSAMRTISILTLVYLPLTAVSAVFSSTIFDFGNWGSGEEKVASGGWWVFVVCCVVMTVVTVTAWWVWLYKSEKKMNFEEERDRRRLRERKTW